jgi:SpoVK/Ycf46/Vps4 family AAA+-type ATPase
MLWNGTADHTLSLQTLTQASKEYARPQLQGLAQCSKPIYTWLDIVLPLAQLQQLREMVAHVRHAAKVLSEWNFASKHRSARGIAALFAGASGTGKTMAADIIATELNLELYKIDVSQVVSKYIGETAKNLSRIFAQAENTGAILFFDEADALFGKRSEIKDAHDRYANIEIAYLLQRIEAYHGIAILATNLKHNLDVAFIRRLRFIVDFPFPDELAREQIWQKAFPNQAPLASDIDFRYLARKLKLSGGSIKNIVLHAAFLAAANDAQIDMACVIEAAKRELEKIGKLYLDSDFPTYPAHVAPATINTGPRQYLVGGAQ